MNKSRKKLVNNKSLFTNPFFFIGVIYTVFRLYVGFLQIISPYIISRAEGFFWNNPLSNFDGIHYLSIAQVGYSQFQQAFFPLYPILIKLVFELSDTSYLLSALFISSVSGLVCLYMFWNLLRIDYNAAVSRWSLIFFISFPTSFFLVATYTESLFLVLVFTSFYCMRKAFSEKTRSKQTYGFISAFFGMMASATRLVGIFLIPSFLCEWVGYVKRKSSMPENKKTVSLLPIILFPLGLFAYIIYLAKQYGDPFLFIHAQPAFGANRSGGEIILLPQVIWRYLKIFVTLGPSRYDFWIAFFEILTFFIVLFILYIGYKMKVRLSYIIFSALVIILPTLSGTFSSIPRYALAAFAIFIVFGNIKSRSIKIIILVTGIILQTVLCALFLTSHFVS